MLMIRLLRVGRKNDPSFRIVVTDRKNSAKSGKSLETLGHYDFRKAPPENRINAARTAHWISKGAQPSPTVHNILVDYKIIAGKKINALPRKSPIAKESKETKETGAGTEGGARRADAGNEESSAPASPPPSSVSGGAAESVSKES